MKNSFKITLIVLAVLILDQTLKFYVKTNFCLGEERLILGAPWARLNFAENAGMAFSLEFGGAFGKLFLSIFRLFAIAALIYVAFTIKYRVAFGLLLGYSLVLAGAIGNIIDSVFYGLIFSNSDYHCSVGPAKFLSTHGYAPILQGRVVDMLYFPMFQVPKSIPFIGGSVFFQAIFNLADASIFCGVVIIFAFYRLSNVFNPPRAKNFTQNIPSVEIPIE